MKFSDMPYTRVDFEKLKTEFAEMGRAFDAAKSGEEQFELHKKYYKLTDHVMTEMTIAEIRHDIDMTDEFYAAEQKFYDENAPVFRNLVVAWQRKLYESRFRPYLEMRIGKVAFKNIELAMKSVDEKLIPLMQEENRLQDDYNRILATAKLDWNGETLNLSLLSPYLNNRSREVRKKAWDLYSGFFAEHAEEFDDIYDKLVKNRTKQGELMGYENYLPLGYARMMRNCYGRSDIQEFRKQVKQDWVPLCQDLNEMRRQKLGLPHLTYIDEGVYLPDGNPNPIGTPEQILMAGRKMYNELSPETAKFMNFMCDNELFDVLGRKTKKVGGYMTYLPDYKAPFIFANFNGTADDADVITHECGHACQASDGMPAYKIRQMIAPFAGIASKISVWIAIAGVFVMYLASRATSLSYDLGYWICTLGIALYALVFLFYLVTLPVELDASRRALKILEKDGLLAGSEMAGARSVLSAAAMTYVAAAASAIVTLLRLISYGKRRS